MPSVLSWLKRLFQKLVEINDTPQRVSLGLGLGVFLGIMPGAGPIASLVLASFFRLNVACALLGSLLTNTWLSFVTFLLSLKIGAFLMRLNWQDVYQQWVIFLKDFHWQNLFKTAVLKTILPVMLGVTTVAFCLGVIVYLACLAILLILKKPNEKKHTQ